MPNVDDPQKHKEEHVNRSVQGSFERWLLAGFLFDAPRVDSSRGVRGRERSSKEGQNDRVECWKIEIEIEIERDTQTGRDIDRDRDRETVFLYFWLHSDDVQIDQYRRVVNGICACRKINPVFYNHTRYNTPIRWESVLLISNVPCKQNYKMKG